jgi:hypothetical protein
MLRRESRESREREGTYLVLENELDIGAPVVFRIVRCFKQLLGHAQGCYTLSLCVAQQPCIRMLNTSLYAVGGNESASGRVMEAAKLCIT